MVEGNSSQNDGSSEGARQYLKGVKEKLQGAGGDVNILNQTISSSFPTFSPLNQEEKKKIDHTVETIQAQIQGALSSLSSPPSSLSESSITPLRNTVSLLLTPVSSFLEFISILLNEKRALTKEEHTTSQEKYKDLKTNTQKALETLNTLQQQHSPQERPASTFLVRRPTTRPSTSTPLLSPSRSNSSGSSFLSHRSGSSPSSTALGSSDPSSFPTSSSPPSSITPSPLSSTSSLSSSPPSSTRHPSCRAPPRSRRPPPPSRAPPPPPPTSSPPLSPKGRFPFSTSPFSKIRSPSPPPSPRSRSPSLSSSFASFFPSSPRSRSPSLSSPRARSPSPRARSPSSRPSSPSRSVRPSSPSSSTLASPRSPRSTSRAPSPCSSRSSTPRSFSSSSSSRHLLTSSSPSINPSSSSSPLSAVSSPIPTPTSSSSSLSSSRVIPSRSPSPPSSGRRKKEKGRGPLTRKHSAFDLSSSPSSSSSSSSSSTNPPPFSALSPSLSFSSSPRRGEREGGKKKKKTLSLLGRSMTGLEGIGVGEGTREREVGTEEYMKGQAIFYDPDGVAPIRLRNIAIDMHDEKGEDKYFHDRLSRLIHRGGPCLQGEGVPYIYDRICAKKLKKFDNKFKIKFQFPNSFSTSIFTTGGVTVGEAVKEAVGRVKKKMRTDGEGGGGGGVVDEERVLLKIPGEEVYVTDQDLPLFSLSYIRHCLEREEEILFVVLEKEKGKDEGRVFPSVFGLTLHSDEELGIETRETLAFQSENISKNFHVHILNVINYQYDTFFSEERKKFKKLEASQFGLFVECSLHYGAQFFSRKLTRLSENGDWGYLVDMGISLSSLPSTVRLCVTVWGCSLKNFGEVSRMDGVDGWRREGKDTSTSAFEMMIPMGSVNFNLYHFNGQLRTGSHTLRLFMDQPSNPLGATAQNEDRSSLALLIHVPGASRPIIVDRGVTNWASRGEKGEEGEEKGEKEGEKEEEKREGSSHLTSFFMGREEFDPSSRPDVGDDFPLKKVIDADPLYVLSPTEKKLTWKFRKYLLTHFPRCLPKVLQSVQWSNPAQVKEARELVRKWPMIPTVDALQLLDAKFTDPVIREFAVGCLSQMSDVELEDYMLLLVQTLKHEPYQSSSLCYLLFLRAFLNPRLLGHTLFWYLESEKDSVEMSIRFRLFKKELLLYFSESFRADLLRQSAIVRQLVIIAKQVKEIREKDKRDELLKTSLKKVEEILLKNTFSLPMNPRIRANGILIEESKTMQSATVPLFLTFRNADTFGSKVRVIFKVGDDLRQDILTLQIIRIMDNLWKDTGADLFVIPYRVVATGSNAGMIEVVPKSRTTAEIHKQSGGALGALKEEVIWSYLKETKANEILMKRVFSTSCAAYCVLSYVLGIGDRHNDNIMIQQTGNLFHIDFGFILGNYLKFAGIDRETTPFVLTREMVYVMGGQQSQLYKEFCNTCFFAYEVIRQNGHLFLSLFSLMLSTGMPSLQKVEDLAYFTAALKLDISESEAEKEFDDLIKKSLKNTRIYLNNMVHIWANS